MVKVTIGSSGDWGHTMGWLSQLAHHGPSRALNAIGKQGVTALSANTPVGRTHETASGWHYKIVKRRDGYAVQWVNSSHPETTATVPMLLQNGHFTKNHGYVPSRDYINPALSSIFNRAGDLISKEVFK